ncbi:Tetraspan membrane protein of hair cell stereocilia [Liparis tanakae]|uniref:Tetraspan membrane protein of hair cell stereocilia n=1 Tax=Liparis tanakae TaxID=230148 RepID=A0A4Z2FET7_9TELE|nr:Tetraspan membrane protein of hair cell stereocilia [Liparis tanakae]
MSVSPALADLSHLYQTEFVRSARAVGALWAACTLCFAILQVVVLVQPSWIGTGDAHHLGAGPVPPSGTLGLFEAVAVLVGVSLVAVVTSLLSLGLFRFCSAASVYKACAWLQLAAGRCYWCYWFYWFYWCYWCYWCYWFHWFYWCYWF